MAVIATVTPVVGLGCLNSCLLVCTGKSDVLLAVSVTTSSSAQPSVLKEGVLEKKGHSAAFLSWPKRFVRVTKGELYYAKPEDPEVCVQCSGMCGVLSCGVVCTCVHCGVT